MPITEQTNEPIEEPVAEPKTGQRIILKDGTTIEGGGVGYSQGYLWCYFSGYTIQEAALIFLSPEKTETIIFEYGEMTDTYNGYTDCRNLSIDVDGRVSVCMAKGEN